MAESFVAEIERQMAEKLIQGCVCGTLERAPQAFGIQARGIPMTVDSRFDMASVGKVFTASCCALLVCQGKLDPDAPFTEYLPDHVLGKDCRITVRNLATHSGGFDNAKPYTKRRWEDFYREAMLKKPVREIGAAFEYSCYNFILLGLILNRITGKDLDTLAREMLWNPLGMTHTTWIAPGSGPLEVEHHFPDRPAGEHNDEVCNQVNIPIGNGSCFSTCGDMLKFAQDMALQKFFPKDYYKLLSTPTFTAGQSVGFDTAGGARRSFGWDMCEARRPKSFTPAAICHSGFTGQTIAVDPVLQKAGIVLTSRTGDWELANQGRVQIIDLML